MFEILKKNFFTYLIIIFFTLFKSSESYIVLPFKINYPKIFGNITKIFNELLDNKLMITLPFGTPQKNVDFYASMNEYIYFLEESSNNKDNDFSKSNSYNFKESKTFNNKTTTFSIIQLKQCYLGEDNIYVYEDINLKSVKEMTLPFYYGSRDENSFLNDKNKKIIGQMGFQLDNHPFRLYEYESFIEQLKKNKIINSYSWYVHYFDNSNKINNFDGAIIIDIFNPKFYSDFPFLKKLDDYNTINVKDMEHILSWTFDFDKIYYTYNDTKFDIIVKLSGLAFETDFIHCPEIYFDSIINSFFNKFIENNICFLVKERYYYIYCEKNSFEKYKNTFPSLYFISVGLNRTYELNSNDLFKDCGNYYLFMIIKLKYSMKVWTLGKIFMKKDLFYFDSNKKIIGYFNKAEKNYIEKNSGDNFFKKIKWYIFIVIGIVVGILIGKKIREKARKLRANELEDNYEYLENEKKGNKNDINDVNNSINLDNKNISNYKAIKSALYDTNE